MERASKVLKDLDARDLMATRPGNRDRRQRELRLTEAGKALEASLFIPLRDAMGRAYTTAGQQAVTGFWHVSEMRNWPPSRGSKVCTWLRMLSGASHADTDSASRKAW